MSDTGLHKSSTNPFPAVTVSVAEILGYLSDDRFLGEREARQYLSLSERKLRKHLSEIKHYRVGKKLLFKKSDLDRWMERFLESSAELDLDRMADEVVNGVLEPGNNR
jgi:excisionase family DNA binding protein